MPTKQNNDDDSGLEVLLTNQQGQLSLTLSNSDSIDAKSLAILGANIAIVIFINQTASGLAGWQYVLLYGSFVLSLALNVFSIWPRRYNGPGIDPRKESLYLAMPRQQLLLQLLSNTQSAAVRNSILNKKRLQACTYSIALTGLGFATLLFIL